MLRVCEAGGRPRGGLGSDPSAPALLEAVKPIKGGAERERLRETKRQTDMAGEGDS